MLNEIIPEYINCEKPNLKNIVSRSDSQSDPGNMAAISNVEFYQTDRSCSYIVLALVEKLSCFEITAN